MEESFEFLEEKLPDGTQEKNNEARMILYTEISEQLWMQYLMQVR